MQRRDKLHPSHSSENVVLGTSIPLIVKRVSDELWPCPLSSGAPEPWQDSVGEIFHNEVIGKSAESETAAEASKSSKEFLKCFCLL